VGSSSPSRTQYLAAMRRTPWILLAALPAILLSVTPANAGDEVGTAEAASANTLRPLAADELTVQSTSGSSTFTVSVSGTRYNEAFGTSVSPAVNIRWECSLQARNPHYSTGNGGVIAKVAVKCWGDIGTIPIQVYSLLGRSSVNSASSLTIVKESYYTQSVVSNGSEKLWYVPALGVAGAKRGAYFRSSASAKPAPPLVPFNIASHASAIVWVP